MAEQIRFGAEFEMVIKPNEEGIALLTQFNEFIQLTQQDIIIAGR